jgi:hypothetical protein
VTAPGIAIRHADDPVCEHCGELRPIMFVVAPRRRTDPELHLCSKCWREGAFVRGGLAAAAVNTKKPAKPRKKAAP